MVSEYIGDALLVFFGILPTPQSPEESASRACQTALAMLPDRLIDGEPKRTIPFEIPLGALLPERVENLLPACKNIGTTHITNGCYRLHPVEWNIGEAAGALGGLDILISNAGITRDQAQGVMQRAVERGLDKREQTPLELVGIDEKAIRRGHRYVTILSDLVEGKVVDVAEGRTTKAATQLLNSLPDRVSETIEAVTMDMWAAYIKAVESELPEATIVFDRFHIKQHLNNAVDLVRR